MRKIEMKCSPALVLQFSYCINMQIYQQKLRHSCTSQMNSRHKSSKLNQSVLCFTISSYAFDFKCLIVSKQTQRILEMISPSTAPSRSRTSAVESNLRCCFHESSCSLPCYVTVDLQMHQCINRCERPQPALDASLSGLKSTVT